MKQILVILCACVAFGVCITQLNATSHIVSQKQDTLAQRVDILVNIANSASIVDSKWVPVGLKKPYAIIREKDSDNKIIYRFELKSGDNSMEGLFPGQKVSRAELSYCYATANDYADSSTLIKAQKLKTVHYAGKGSCQQGDSVHYSFKIKIPSNMNCANADVIFAQWHGMPTRTMIADETGHHYRPGDKGYKSAMDKMAFRRGQGYEAGKPTGWIMDHGGVPVLAFGFQGGYFYLKAHSDKKLITDVYELCDVNAGDTSINQKTSCNKISTIIKRIPTNQFPRDKWVTLSVKIRWTKYDPTQNIIERNGTISAQMKWSDKEKEHELQLAKNQNIYAGRNDENGYYFKFGAYRQNGNNVPVKYYITGFEQEIIK